MKQNWFYDLLEKIETYKWFVIALMITLGKFLSTLQSMLSVFNNQIIKIIYLILVVIFFIILTLGIISAIHSVFLSLFNRNVKEIRRESKPVVFKNTSGIEKKGKALVISFFGVILLLELIRTLILTGFINMQPQEVLQKSIILILITICTVYIFKGFSWAKTVLGMICFYLVVTLFPAAMLQIFSSYVIMSPDTSEKIIFILTIGLPAVLYVIMGVIFIKSRYISEFISYQKIKRLSASKIQL